MSIFTVTNASTDHNNVYTELRLVTISWRHTTPQKVNKYLLQILQSNKSHNTQRDVQIQGEWKNTNNKLQIKLIGLHKVNKYFIQKLTRVEALRNRSSVNQIASADFARNVTVKCLQFYSPLHCHGFRNKNKKIHTENETE